MAYAGPIAFPVVEGGTGDTSFTAYAPVCGGTSTTGALQSANTGISTSGFVLTSNGSSALPSFQAASGGSGAAKAWALISYSTTPSATLTVGFNIASVAINGGTGRIDVTVTSGFSTANYVVVACSSVQSQNAVIGVILNSSTQFSIIPPNANANVYCVAFGT